VNLQGPVRERGAGLAAATPLRTSDAVASA
jgi:hypothetical protein